MQSDWITHTLLTWHLNGTVTLGGFSRCFLFCFVLCNYFFKKQDKTAKCATTKITAIPLLGVYARYTRTFLHTHTHTHKLYKNVYVCFIHNNLKLGISLTSFYKSMLNKLSSICMREYFLATTGIHKNLDWPQGHYAAWKKANLKTLYTLWSHLCFKMTKL